MREDILADLKSRAYEENPDITREDQEQEAKEMLAQLMEKRSIKIPLSENDLQELQGGEEFDWTFDGVDVHLYQTNEDEE